MLPYALYPLLVLSMMKKRSALGPIGPTSQLVTPSPDGAEPPDLRKSEQR